MKFEERERVWREREMEGVGLSSSNFEKVSSQCLLLRTQLDQVSELKRDAVLALHDLSDLAENLDHTLRPVKEATDDLSRGLANMERALRKTGETVEQMEASRKLQRYIDQGLPRCTTIEVVEDYLENDRVGELEREDNDLDQFREYLLAVEKLEESMKFLDEHFGGVDSPRGVRERSRTRDSLLMAITHCEVEFSNRLMFVSQIEQSIVAETKQANFIATVELREDTIRHRRNTYEEENPNSPSGADGTGSSRKVAYLMKRRKKELRLINMLAEAILNVNTTNASDSIFSSYADVRSTSLEEKIRKMMLRNFPDDFNLQTINMLESEEDALERLLKCPSEKLQNMHWEDIQRHARIWIYYVENTLSQVDHERNFARKIFMYEKDSDTAFALVLKSHFNTIVSHATGISKSRKTPEKVFALLDMLNAWDKEKALTESMLRSDSSSVEAKELAKRTLEMYNLMVNSVRDTYREFTDAVERDAVGQSKGNASGSAQGSKKGGGGVKWTPTKGIKVFMNMDSSPNHSSPSQSSVPENGTIHPLAAYLIQYCRRLQEFPNASKVLSRKSQEGMTPAEDQMVMAKIIVKLLGTLFKNLKIKVQRMSTFDGKTVHAAFGKYPNKMKQELLEQDTQSFTDIFLLNNGNYILRSAEKFKYSDAIDTTGFLKEMKENVRRHTKSYLHKSWRLSVEWLNMISETLEKHQNMNPKLMQGKELAESEKRLKHLLRQFESTWKIRYRTQRAWYVPDPELRQSLKSKLEQYLLPDFVECAAALNAYVEASEQAHLKRFFPLLWEEGSIRKAIELQLFEGHS